MSPSPKDTTPLDSLPVGRLGIIPLKSCSALGARVNDYIVDWRKDREYSHFNNLEFEGYERDSYLIQAETPRLSLVHNPPVRYWAASASVLSLTIPFKIKRPLRIS